jgi:hypothetical protein
MCLLPLHIVITRLLHNIRDFQLCNIIRTFDNRRIKAAGNVRCDVTVEWPGTGVIGFELDDDVTLFRDEEGVAANWVVWIDDGLAVPFAVACGEDVKVVPVQMHGVDCEARVLEYDADRGVLAEVVNVPLGVIGVRIVSLVGEE